MMKKERVLQIQALRALACFSVLVDHTKVPSTVGIGQFGVFIFFMISGYVMMLSTERTDNSGMLAKRFLRIAPPYYVMTAAIIVINLVNQYVYTFKEYTDISLYKIFTSVTFFAFLPNGLSTIVSVGWTVSIEMFFYLLFYVAYRISFRYRGLLTIGGILLIQMVSSPLIALGIDIPYARYHMIFFAIGIAVWYLKQYLKDKIEAEFQSKPVQYGIIFGSIVAFMMLVAEIYYQVVEKRVTGWIVKKYMGRMVGKR